MKNQEITKHHYNSTRWEVWELLTICHLGYDLGEETWYTKLAELYVNLLTTKLYINGHNFAH